MPNNISMVPCSTETDTDSKKMEQKQQDHNHHHQHHHHMVKSPSSLSIEDCGCYSSRYSSLQDTESLKSAMLDSFRMHWIQAWSIMECKILNDITIDDLSSIVNHLEQMISLLMEENSSGIASSISTEQSNTSADSVPNFSVSPLLDFLSTEAILTKIFQWSEMSGEWKRVMYLEQLKIYELLISQLSSSSCCQNTDPNPLKTFVRPLIKLLDSLSIFLGNNSALSNCVEIEKRLVILLNTLCVAINQNIRLLDLFLIRPSDDDDSPDTPTNNNNNNNLLIEIEENSSSPTDELSSPSDCDHQQESSSSSTFSIPIFSLAIQYVHREGGIGQQSRDSLLLCLAWSRQDERVADYVANRTDFCPILATALSGHFSSLPRVLIGQSGPEESVFRVQPEVEHFLKCLEFCNAVIQISHPIIQVQLLKYIYNGFLISVIGPALHQDVANVPVSQLETMPSYSNTLDEIITTTAYLDLFIRTISESKLIRIFLEFLCFELYDNNFILATFITRIEAKSKLSLITLNLFKTLLDLNCEDFLYELIYKHLLRGRHLNVEKNRTPEVERFHQTKSYQSYQKNWLTISAQKLLSTSVSYYLCHNGSLGGGGGQCTDADSVSSFDSGKFFQPFNIFHQYLDYLNDARISIDRCTIATKTWRNPYLEPCDMLNEVQDDNIIFCTMDDDPDDNPDFSASIKTLETLDINDIVTRNTIMEKFSPGFKMRNCFYDEKLKKINCRNDSGFFSNHHLQPPQQQTNPDPPAGRFLAIIFEKFEKFFENDVLTNLHLTGLITRLCHFPHKLLLSLLFDETLSRAKNVPCFIHVLQKLALEAQNHCDEIPDFESMFQAAKSNLQSVPIGDFDGCSLMVSNMHRLRAGSNLSLASKQSESITVPKALVMIKSFFSRPNTGGGGRQPSSRRPSNASTVSSTGQLLEVTPSAVRFINQHQPPARKENKTGMVVDDHRQKLFNEFVYNLIIFDEFLMELSAILIEHSLSGFCGEI